MRIIYAVFIIGYFSSYPVIDGYNQHVTCLEDPYCICENNIGFKLVFCRGVVVFQPIHELLVSLRSRIRMMLYTCNLITLPNHAFQNISVFEFSSNCPLSNIHDDAFDGVVDLQEVYLIHTTFRTIPYGLQNLSDLRTLLIRNHQLVSLNHELWNLKSLTKLYLVTGTLEELAEDVFAQTPYIGYINLSYNHLKFVHPNTLKPLLLLRILLLKGNQILSIDGVLDIPNLEEIDLSENNLTTVDYVFNTEMVRLKFLNISRNPINSFVFLSSEISNFPSLRVLEMAAINCSEIDSSFFRRLPELGVANLSFNRLKAIPKTLFNKYLLALKLENNSITSIKGISDNSPNVIYLKLSNNRISDLSKSFQNLKNLSFLHFDGNDIERISNGDFEGLGELTDLNLAFNKIQLIESKIFSRLKKLQLLSLNGNCFQSMNRSIQNLPLIQLSVESSCLENIEQDFSGLTKLRNLSLSNNSIASVDGMFQDLQSLQILNLSGNKLTTLSRDTFPENLRLKLLWLETGNQLHCDCRLTWLIKYHAQMYNTVIKDNPVCHSPLRLSRKPIRDLTVKDLTEWPEDCPDFCSCECVSQGRTFYVRAVCSKRSLFRVPDIFPNEIRHLDLSGNKLESLRSLSHDVGNNLIALNLENNKLTTLDGLPQNLVNLRIAGNLINRLPRSLLSNGTFEVLTLAKNPWVCDCETVDFWKWLLSLGGVVLDVHETKCGPGGHADLHGKVIIELTDTDLCPSRIVLYVSVALVLLGTLLLASSMVLMFSKYNLYIKAWLYAHGHTWVKEYDTEDEKLFDAFLSYHEADEEFVVTDIIPKLEAEKHKFNLCIPNRDIVCGIFSTVAHIEAMLDSSRILVILTENYINDVSCMAVFQQAYQQALEDKVQRVILITVGDIRKTEDMNPELVAILESTNNIPWQGTLFMERLYYAMPKKMPRIVVKDDDVVELM